MVLLYHGGHFFCWRKAMYTDKTTEPVSNHWQTLSYNVVSNTPHNERDSNSKH
jgi:hypothetical protein